MNCPICNGETLLMWGCGWDYDRRLCSVCNWEQELLQSTMEDGTVMLMGEDE